MAPWKLFNMWKNKLVLRRCAISSNSNPQRFMLLSIFKCLCVFYCLNLIREVLFYSLYFAFLLLVTQCLFVDCWPLSIHQCLLSVLRHNSCLNWSAAGVLERLGGIHLSYAWAVIGSKTTSCSWASITVLPLIMSLCGFGWLLSFWWRMRVYRLTDTYRWIYAVCAKMEEKLLALTVGLERVFREQPCAD